MRIRHIITSTLAAVALAGGASLVHAAATPVASPTTEMLQRLTQPHEDSPQFDCRRHGNRACGVRLDPKPNDGVAQSIRYVIQFNKAGQPVSVKPLGR